MSLQKLHIHTEILDTPQTTAFGKFLEKIASQLPEYDPFYGRQPEDFTPEELKQHIQIITGVILPGIAVQLTPTKLQPRTEQAEAEQVHRLTLLVDEARKRQEQAVNWENYNPTLDYTNGLGLTEMTAPALKRLARSLRAQIVGANFDLDLGQKNGYIPRGIEQQHAKLVDAESRVQSEIDRRTGCNVGSASLDIQKHC